MNPQSLAKRLAKAEAAIATKGTAIRLESGETVYLKDRAAEVRIVFDLIRANHDYRESGELVDVDIERVRLFAQSIPSPNGGSIAHTAKQMCADYLERHKENDEPGTDQNN